MSDDDEDEIIDVIGDDEAKQLDANINQRASKSGLNRVQVRSVLRQIAVGASMFQLLNDDHPPQQKRKRDAPKTRRKRRALLHDCQLTMPPVTRKRAREAASASASPAKGATTSPVDECGDVSMDGSDELLPSDDEDDDVEYHPSVEEAARLSDSDAADSVVLASSSPTKCMSKTPERTDAIAAAPSDQLAICDSECDVIDRIEAIDVDAEMAQPPLISTADTSQERRLTRSTADLRSIPLVAIEAQFKPPDVEPDLYQATVDAQDDADYLQFLSDIFYSTTELDANSSAQIESTRVDRSAIAGTALDDSGGGQIVLPPRSDVVDVVNLDGDVADDDVFGDPDFNYQAVVDAEFGGDCGVGINDIGRQACGRPGAASAATPTASAVDLIEYKDDRTTRIPRKEVDLLLQDSQTQLSRDAATRLSLSPPPKFRRGAGDGSERNGGLKRRVLTPQGRIVGDSSYKLTFDQRDAIRHQMQVHVQLLAQTLILVSAAQAELVVREAQRSVTPAKATEVYTQMRPWLIATATPQRRCPSVKGVQSARAAAAAVAKAPPIVPNTTGEDDNDGEDEDDEDNGDIDVCGDAGGVATTAWPRRPPLKAEKAKLIELDLRAATLNLLAMLADLVVARDVWLADAPDALIHSIVNLDPAIAMWREWVKSGMGKVTRPTMDREASLVTEFVAFMTNSRGVFLYPTLAPDCPIGVDDDDIFDVELRRVLDQPRQYYEVDARDLSGVAERQVRRKVTGMGRHAPLWVPSEDYLLAFGVEAYVMGWCLHGGVGGAPGRRKYELSKWLMHISLVYGKSVKQVSKRIINVKTRRQTTLIMANNPINQMFLNHRTQPPALTLYTDLASMHLIDVSLRELIVVAVAQIAAGIDQPRADANARKCMTLARSAIPYHLAKYANLADARMTDRLTWNRRRSQRCANRMFSIQHLLPSIALPSSGELGGQIQTVGGSAAATKDLVVEIQPLHTLKQLDVQQMSTAVPASVVNHVRNHEAESKAVMTTRNNTWHIKTAAPRAATNHGTDAQSETENVPPLASSAPAKNGAPTAEAALAIEGEAAENCENDLRHLFEYVRSSFEKRDPSKFAAFNAAVMECVETSATEAYKRLHALFVGHVDVQDMLLDTITNDEAARIDLADAKVARCTYKPFLVALRQSFTLKGGAMSTKRAAMHRAAVIEVTSVLLASANVPHSVRAAHAKQIRSRFNRLMSVVRRDALTSQYMTAVMAVPHDEGQGGHDRLGASKRRRAECICLCHSVFSSTIAGGSHCAHCR